MTCIDFADAQIENEVAKINESGGLGDIDAEATGVEHHGNDNGAGDALLLEQINEVARINESGGFKLGDIDRNAEATGVEHHGNDNDAGDVFLLEQINIDSSNTESFDILSPTDPSTSTLTNGMHTIPISSSRILNKHSQTKFLHHFK